MHSVQACCFRPMVERVCCALAAAAVLVFTSVRAVQVGEQEHVDLLRPV